MVRFVYGLFLLLSAQVLLPGQVLNIGDAPAAPAASGGGVQKFAASAAATVSNWYDTSNRALVSDSWNQVMVPTLSVPMGWSGDVVAGNAGNTSQAWKDAVDTRINWFRAMAGVQPNIAIDLTFSAKDQQAAMMFSVNKQISHTPPTTWINYTADGAQAAANSNICYIYGENDPGCVYGYMIDLGSNNSAAGHRRWLLYPQTQFMGTGDVPQTGSYPYANALWVFDGNYGTTRPATRTAFVAWPPPGYVPYQVAGPRWSFSYPNADFANATVTMTRGGAAVPVRLEAVQNGYGENTIVWVPDNLDTSNFLWQGTPPVADTTTLVTINNAVIGGVSQSFSYSVTVFDPSTPAPTAFSFTPASAFVPNTGGTGSASLTVTPAGTAWSAISSDPWLGITSGASGTGSGTIAWSAAANPSSLSRGATITAGGATYTVTQAGTGASPVSVSPPVGNSGRQAFTFVARHLSGANSIRYAQFLFSRSGLSALNGCYISYSPAGNVFYLLSDDMTQWYGLAGGSGNTVGNAQCTIYGATSGSVKSGTDLTTTVDISFRSGFAGSKNIYQSAGDTLGNGSGWAQVGTWNDTGDLSAVELVSMTPNAGSGASHVFTAAIKDSDGATTITFAQLVMNNSLNGFNGCFIHYDRASNVFFLLNDAGTAFSGLVGGTGGQVSNSQCTLHGTGSGGTVSGSVLTITYNLDFSAGFAGVKKTFMWTADSSGVIENWHQIGTWTR